jgi:predicted flavoprotein YhiN
MRVFPVSDNGKDIVGVFERLSQSKKVTLHYKTGIESICHADGQFELTTSQ